MSTTLLPAVRLHPNDYNPNEMTKAEFAELVTEVRHLGRLPKPVIVRPNGAGYTIIDGEHGWRAACEVGLSEVPCEVIDADDFESMRQTYKRNQHGTHNAVRLGQMFERMMETRDLSQRALAAEVAVSEGTIRNALLYAEAAKLRNSYAFEKLAVRQLRAYLAMPAPVRDIWLDSGADLKALGDALCARVEMDDGKEHRIQFELETFQELVEFGLDVALESRGGKRFVESCHRALQLYMWRREFVRYFDSIDEYLRPVARLHLPVKVLDYLPSKVDSEGIKPMLPPDVWAGILEKSISQAKDAADRDSLIAASVRVTLRRMGKSLEDLSDPRMIELLQEVQKAPDFIRDADLSLVDKWRLARATAGVPDDVLEAAKREACRELEQRDRVVFGKHDLPADLVGKDVQTLAKAAWARITVTEALDRAIGHLMAVREGAERKALFADRDRLRATVISSLLSGGPMDLQVAGRSVRVVLEERLSRLPWPEFVLFAEFVLDDGPGVLWRWRDAVCAEVEAAAEVTA